MKFEGDLATLQRRVAETADLQRRRLAVLDAIALQPGESVLEVGCGGGALLPMLAAAAGASGRVVGIDVSPDQIAAAEERCSGLAGVEVAVQDVRQLPYADGSFDAIVAIQVIEFLDRPVEALSALRRVCKAGGRAVIFATNWDTMLWNCDAPELTARVLAAWREHAPFPNLAADLRPLLTDAGFRMLRQEPVTIVNNAFHEDAYAYWGARVILAFARGRDLVSPADAEAWLKALEKAQAEGRFFFSSTPVLTLAVAV